MCYQSCFWEEVIEISASDCKIFIISLEVIIINVIKYLCFIDFTICLKFSSDEIKNAKWIMLIKYAKLYVSYMWDFTTFKVSLHYLKKCCSFFFFKILNKYLKLVN